MTRGPKTLQSIGNTIGSSILLTVVVSCRTASPAPVEVPVEASVTPTVMSDGAATDSTPTVRPVQPIDPAPAVQAGGDDGWEFMVAPYLWAANLNGLAGVGGSPLVPIGISFSDMVEDLDFGGSVFFEGHRGQWGFLVDGTHVALSGDAEVMPGVSIKTGTDITLVEVDATYRPQEFEAGEIDFLFGLRYFDLTNELELQAGTQEGGVDFIDPVVGVRGRWELGENWRLNIRTDVAGFGVGSELTWQVLTMFGYSITDAWDLVIGYRGMSMNIDKDGLVLDAQIQGVMLGATYSW